MFSNIKLVSRSNHLEESPNLNWTVRTRIVCVCDLELGFSEKISLNMYNALLLEEMIKIYKALGHTRSKSEVFSINDDYELVITGQYLEVYRKYGNQSKSLLTRREKVYTYSLINNFKLTILSQLFPNTNEK